MRRKPLYVYLDQKDWIHLAQAHTGKQVGDEYKDVLAYLTAERAAGNIVCPLSSTHYMELSMTSKAEQRLNITTVMTLLSSFTTISIIKPLQIAEIEHALQLWFDRPVSPTEPKPFGFGAFFALSGQSKGFQFDKEDASFKELLKQAGQEKINEIVAQANLRSETMLLCGSDDDKIRKLYQAADNVANKRATQQAEQATAFFDGSDDKSKTETIIANQYLYWELSDDLYAAMTRAGIAFEELLALGPDGMTYLVHDIPTADVITSMAVANFKMGRRWTKNEVHDLDALGKAVPYCDIVVTDKHAATQLCNAGMDTKYDTIITSKLEGLPEIVKALQVKQV